MEKQGLPSPLFLPTDWKTDAMAGDPATTLTISLPMAEQHREGACLPNHHGLFTNLSVPTSRPYERERGNLLSCLSHSYLGILSVLQLKLILIYNLISLFLYLLPLLPREIIKSYIIWYFLVLHLLNNLSPWPNFCWLGN